MLGRSNIEDFVKREDFLEHPITVYIIVKTLFFTYQLFLIFSCTRNN